MKREFCNPGGVGHEWVKRLFISKKYKEGENPQDYVFIPATVHDNKVLLENDKEYVQMLDSLPDGLRQAWRDGNWDMLAGQYFSEFDRSVHVVEPFEIPKNWKVYRTIDYGLDCLACLWVAVDERGDYYVFREYARDKDIPVDNIQLWWYNISIVKAMLIVDGVSIWFYIMVVKK